MSAPADLPPLPATFRPSLTRAILIGCGIGIFVVITAIACLLGIGGGEAASFVLTAVLLAGVCFLLARPKVVATTEGVTVVNLTTRRTLGWAQIVRVTLRGGDPWAFLDLSDGTSLPVLGIQPGLAREKAVFDARALSALVDAHTPVHD